MKPHFSNFLLYYYNTTKYCQLDGIKRTWEIKRYDRYKTPQIVLKGHNPMQHVQNANSMLQR